MRAWVVGSMVLLMSLAAAAQAADEKPAADEKVPSENQPEAVAKAEKEPFTPPDGWRAKKRGQYTVYCRKDYNVKGTRFPAETCYDEAGIRAMIEAQREDQMMVDKMRRICGNDSTCGTH